MHHLETISLPHSLDGFTRIIDVRTPLEYEDDHLPRATNLPVLSNEQRIEVGTLHKKNPFAARILGARYISENTASHLSHLSQTWDRSESPLIYCWRGGLRSQSLTHVLRSIGWRAILLEGGYKAYRKHIITDLSSQLQEDKPDYHVLSGLTGTGKTRLLHHLRAQGAQILDLEGLANHRGSLLGSVGPQPTQKQFENRLHQEISTFHPAKPVFTEAESNRIGKLSIPSSLWKKLHTATVTTVHLPLEHRAQLLLNDYPRFLEQPAELCELLDHLRSLRGHEQVDNWHQLIEAKDWATFLQSILQDHYDLCYRPAGSEGSNYQQPRHNLFIASHHDIDFMNAATQLIATANP